MTGLYVPSFFPSSWRRPPEFESSSGAASVVSRAAEQLASMGLAESDSEGDAAEAAGSSQSGGPQGAAAACGSGGAEQQTQQQLDDAAASGAAAAAAAAQAAEEVSDGEDFSSEDDLPPIPRFNNRKVIEYEVSDSDSDED